MKKLRSRKVFKIPTSYIAGHNYEFEMTIDKARGFEYLISIANNQVFNAIGRITGKTSNYKLVDGCYAKINREKQKAKPSKQYISGLRQQIDACHEIGVRVPVYLSAGLDEKDFERISHIMLDDLKNALSEKGVGIV